MNIDYPDKIKVTVTYAEPQISQNQNIDPLQAYVTLARTSLPEEFRFVNDTYNHSITTNVSEDNVGGAMQIEFFELIITTTNPQYRDDLYNLIKFMVLRDRKNLLSRGLFSIYRTSGRDIPMDTQTNLPVLLYKASLIYHVTSNMTYQNTEDVMEDFVIVSTLGGPLISGGHYLVPEQFSHVS